MDAEAYKAGYIAGGIEGMKSERDRIIALIKETYPHWEEYEWDLCDPGILFDIIALIKGKSE